LSPEKGFKGVIAKGHHAGIMEGKKKRSGKSLRRSKEMVTEKKSYQAGEKFHKKDGGRDVGRLGGKERCVGKGKKKSGMKILRGLNILFDPILKKRLEKCLKTTPPGDEFLWSTEPAPVKR